MIEVTEYEIRKTNDYSYFKLLEGNREVLDRRKDKIKKSIVDIGYLINPIIVNEKHEIIDGQGRFLALKELEMPVYFIVINGIGVEHCRYLNMYQEKWRTIDYVKSYAKRSEDYRRLLALVQNHPDFSYTELFAAIYNGIGYCNGGYNQVIQSGIFKANALLCEKADECLQYTKRFLPYIRFTKGNKQNSHLSRAIIFCFYQEEIDNELLYKQFEKYHDTAELLKNVGNQKDALTCVGDIYNYRARKRDDVHLQTLYKKRKKSNATTTVM